MRPDGGRRRFLLSLLVLALIGAFGGVGSWAVWTVTDSNTNNVFTTSSILLQDNQGGQAGTTSSAGTAMFTVTNLSPGSTATTGCMGVKISGTATASSLVLSAGLGGAGQAALQGQLTMDVATYNTSGSVSVTGGSNTNLADCTNYPGTGSNTTVGTQGATLATWAGSTYTLTNPPTDIWYKFTVSGLPGGLSCATYCGKTITLALTWTLTTT
jgi:hypothetical protein